MVNSNNINLKVATSSKYSRTYFIIGLLLGLLLGIYVSLKFIQQDNSIDYMPISIQTVTDTATKIKVKKRKKKPIKKSVVKIRNNSKKKIAKNDSLTNDSISLDTNDIIIESDSIQNVNDSINLKTISNKPDSIINEPNDSLRYEVLKVGNKDSDNDIHIAKNELIYAIFVRPQGNRNDFLCSTNYNSKRDSLLINNIKDSDEDGLYVEFWRSPINYTGYKLSHNTLVLFGIYQYTSIQLKYLKNGVLELEYLDNKYNLKCSEDFIPINLKSNL